MMYNENKKGSQSTNLPSTDALTTPKNMISISKYKLEVNKNGKKYVVSQEQIPCTCGGHLAFKEYRLRIVRLPSEDAEFIEIRVLYCVDCGKSHRELPDFLLPYKHYTAQTVEAAVDRKKAECSAEERTVKRWRAWFKRIRSYLAAAIVAALSEFEKVRLRALDPLDTLRAAGSGWLAGAMRRYVNSGGTLHEIT